MENEVSPETRTFYIFHCPFSIIHWLCKYQFTNIPFPPIIEKPPVIVNCNTKALEILMENMYD